MDIANGTRRSHAVLGAHTLRRILKALLAIFILILGICISGYRKAPYLPPNSPNLASLERSEIPSPGESSKLKENFDDQDLSFKIPPSTRSLEDTVARLTRSVKILEDDLQGIEAQVLKFTEKRLTERDAELRSWILQIFGKGLKGIEKPDYALWLGGAQIIPHLTSPTYQLHPNVLHHKLLQWLFSTRAVITSQPPSTALRPDNTLGNCWPFPGHNGTLGIVLARQIIVQEIVIEHTHPQSAYDVWSAPREFRLLGLDEESNNYYWLMTGVFDIFSKGHIQSFPIQHPLPTTKVLLHILSNHGDTEFTCLYQIKIHGRQV